MLVLIMALLQAIPDFDNAEVAFKAKSTMEMHRALLIFRLCGVQPLVANSRRLIDTSYKVGVHLFQEELGIQQSTVFSG